MALRFPRHWRRVLLPVVLVLAGLALWIVDPVPLRLLRNAQFDQYQRWHPRNFDATPVRIIDIDDESLRRIGQWPWPRTRMAALLDQLRGQGAAVVGFDVVFAEPDRTAPRAIGELWPQSQALQQALAPLPDPDQVFARSLSHGRSVLGFALTRRREAGVAADVLPPEVHPPYRFVQKGQVSPRDLYAFNWVNWPLPQLAQATQGWGAFTFHPDSDGVLRRVPLVVQHEGKNVPGLAMEMLRVATGQSNYVLGAVDEADAGQGVGLANVRVGPRVLPSTQEGEYWVHYTRPQRARYIPAWKVLAGQVPRSEIDGRLLLVGTSAYGLMDIRFSPLGGAIPGAEVHAQALEQMLLGHHLSRPAWAWAMEALTLVAGGLTVGLVALSAGALLSALWTLGVLSFAMALSWWMFVGQGLLIDAATPALLVLVVFVVCSGVHHFISERRQRWIKQAFSRYISPNLVNHLVRHPGQLALSGRRQNCSFIFTDLAGFTTLMETIQAEKAVSMLNAYLDGMIRIAFQHEGTLDRIMGDAVAIVFSTPVQQTDHRQRALDCALDMDRFATQFADQIRAQGEVFFGRTRIGVHCGEAIVGNFGGETFFDYRALGDPVNTAARLESVNKHLGTRVCVSQAILDGCAPLPVRPVGRLVLKGKRQPLMAFEPVLPDTRQRADLAEYTAAYELLNDDTESDGSPHEPVRHDAALAAFSALASAYPQDPLVALHHGRLLAGEGGKRMVLADK